MSRRPKRLLLGVTGSIAAYAAADLIEQSKLAGFEVTVMMTEEAQQFIGPLTLRALSGRPVHTSMFHDDAPDGMIHISLAEAADVVVIAPATAHSIAKLAQGMADDLLSCVALATRAPIVIAPAMNVLMYEHCTVQDNLVRVRALGYQVVGPIAGTLACGYTDMGHIASTTDILSAVTCATRVVPRRRVSRQRRR
jgi:phosphopantothenoylcysteine synthetase/decarboxylase